jgi:hypothetical protein
VQKINSEKNNILFTQKNYAASQTMCHVPPTYQYLSQRGIDIETITAGIVIPTSGISIQYRSIPNRTESPYSGTGLLPVLAFSFITVPD